MHSLDVHAERAQVAGEFEAADLVRREQPGGAAADRRHDADFGIEPHCAGGHAELFGDGVGGQHAGLVAERPAWVVAASAMTCLMVSRMQAGFVMSSFPRWLR
jgi:hypothetical protein